MKVEYIQVNMDAQPTRAAMRLCGSGRSDGAG